VRDQTGRVMTTTARFKVVDFEMDADGWKVVIWDRGMRQFYRITKDNVETIRLPRRKRKPPLEQDARQTTIEEAT